MTSITCPHCARVGTLQSPPQPGKWVRCPGCRERFQVEPDGSGGSGLGTDQGADLGIDLGYGAALDRGLPLDDLADAPTPGEKPVASVDPPSASADAAQPTLPTSAAWTVPTLPEEPWFYGWLVGLAGFLWSLGFGLMGLGILPVFVMVVALPGVAGTPAALGVVLYGLESALLLVLTSTSMFTYSALIHLGVDHARNARSARHLIAVWVYRAASGGDQ